MDALIEILPGLMFACLVLGLFSNLPVPIVLCAVTLVFGGFAVALGELRMVHVSLLPSRVFGGIIENQVLVAAPMFIFMGIVMEKTRIAEDLLISLQRVLRIVPGGLALAVVLMGTILAAATGIIGASVVMLTVLAIPTMIERGYSPAFASGTVASAGTLGILIPPSVMLVFMGDLLTLNLAKLFVCALLPGLFLAAVYLIYIVVRAALDPASAPAAPPLRPEERTGIWLELTVSLLVPLLIIVSVLGSILGGIATPTEAAGVGAFAALVLGLARGRLNFRTLGESMDGSVRTLGMLFFIFVAATAFSYIFRKIGGEHFIVESAQSLNLGDWGLLAMMMIMIFIMGFFFDWIEITLILLPIFAPIVQLMDFGDHIAKPEVIYWFAVLMAVNLQTSFLTPPFGFALFYLKGAAGDIVTMQQVYRGIIPFVLLQLGVLLVLIWQPEIAVWLPEKVLGELTRLAGKRIAVIGAGSVGPGWGNGKAAAVTFAREGAQVLCVDRDEDATRDTSDLILGEGGQSEPFHADVTSPDAGEAVAQAMQTRFGGYDVLHYNVGVSLRGGAAEVSDADWSRVFDINLTGALRLTRAALPGMRAQGAGVLIYVSSLAAVYSGPYSYASYEASKAALCRFARSVARENAPFGIRANTILPGMIDTPHVGAFVDQETDREALARQRAAMVPLGRQGTAWDIANAAAFLASDAAGYITGVDLRVDGGLSC